MYAQLAYDSVVL